VKLAAALRKEWLSETRSSHGIFTAALFGLNAAVAMTLASYTVRLSPPVAASLVVVLLVFSALFSVPRSFISEDEQGTVDLLVMVADVETAYWGKVIFQSVAQILTGFVVSVVFCAASGTAVQNVGLLFGSVAGITLSLALSLSLAGALVVGATNRWVLAAVVSLPLVVPTIFLGYGLVLTAFDPSMGKNVQQYAIGLAGASLISGALGPTLVREAWKRS